MLFLLVGLKGQQIKNLQNEYIFEVPVIKNVKYNESRIYLNVCDVFKL